MFAAEAVPGIAFLMCTALLPETPRWLIKKGYTEKALGVLQRINGLERGKEVSDEIQLAISEESDVHLLDLFTAKLCRPLVLSMLVCFFAEALSCAFFTPLLPTNSPAGGASSPGPTRQSGTDNPRSSWRGPDLLYSGLSRMECKHTVSIINICYRLIFSKNPY